MDEVVKGYRPEPALAFAAQSPKLRSGQARARAWLRSALRESGLLYGTPAAPRAGEGAPRAAEEALFLAVLRALCRVGLDVAALTAAPPGPRKEQLLVLVAAMAGLLDDAEEVHRRVARAAKQWPLPPALWLRVEEALAERAPSLTGDPYFGLVLHNGAVYADAALFGRLALAYFSRPGFPRDAAARRLQFAAAQKALLTRVLIGLTCAERRPGYPTRRAVLRQIEDLRLPAGLADETHDFARAAFERPPPLDVALRGVRSRDMRRFVLEQTVLASLVDGHRSERELAWVRGLAKELGFSPAEHAALELQVAEFYARHRDVVDVFNTSAGADVMGAELVDEMQRAVRKNYKRLLQEVRETGELSVLLARAASGKTLSADEKRRMREQLIDIAKVIPALAIFTAPGGVLLLIALARVLRFDLMPSAFREDPFEVEARERARRAPAPPSGRRRGA